MLTEHLLGQQLDEYRLDSLLGRGGMAQVFRSLDVNLERQAAVKIIDAPFRADTDYIERFEREAQAIAQLRHPNIVNMYKYGEVDKLLYIAMEFIEGNNLGQELVVYQEKNKPFPPEKAIKIIQQVCLALDYAHSQGIIHRDIKPPNIMLDKDDHAILTDFGLVLLNDRKTQGDAFGSPHYIAPEQAISSANAVPQSDLYAMGVILYEMFTGKLPFDADHPYDLAMMHMSDPPPPPRDLNPNLSPELETVILKALAKEPEDRYQTGQELADALEQTLSMTRPVSMSEKKKITKDKPLVLDKLGRYIITQSLSDGSLAKVYLAHHEKSKRKVAIKLLLSKPDPDKKSQQQFRQQVEQITTLKHPHILPVNEFGLFKEYPYIVVEYLTGGTLRDWLDNRKDESVPLPLVERIIQNIANALDYIHTQNIMHGALRPSNIMLADNSQFRLTNVGVMSLIDNLNLTIFGPTIETATYLSPERIEGQTYSPYTDIYALGVILYELLSGYPPFQADIPLDILMKHKKEAPISPCQINPQLPQTVESVILKALAKDSANCYQTASDLATAFSQAIAN